MTPTVWLLISTALIMLTVPGVALFYGGMSKKKNVLSTMALPLSALMLVSCEWMLGGETLVFGRDPAANLGRAGGESALLVYHAIVGALALALIAGSLIERIRFLFFLVFGMAWVALVYGPIAYWLWGGGWLTRMGSLDFAGGAVVHLSAGVSALVVAIMVGPRRGYGGAEMLPSHLPFSFCGAAFMWVGWCGFTAGTGLASMVTATGAFVAIQLAASAATLTWMAWEWGQRGKPTALGVMSGAVAGLVAIAPAAGYVGPLSAMAIGAGAGLLCYMVVNFVKPILGYDDSLDVFGLHGVGGMWGMVATGLFASTAVNPDGSDGLLFGYPYLFFAQLVAVLAVSAFAAGTTFLLVTALKKVLWPRVDEESELIGLDLAQHGEKAYSA